MAEARVSPLRIFPTLMIKVLYLVFRHLYSPRNKGTSFLLKTQSMPYKFSDNLVPSDLVAASKAIMASRSWIRSSGVSLCGLGAP